MKKYIIADIGSTTTKVLFIQDDKILAREEAKTTVEKPDEDVSIGLQLATQLIKYKIKEEVAEDFHLGIFPPTFVGNCQDIEDNQRISFSAAMVAIGLSSVVSESFGIRGEIEAVRNLLKKRGKIDSGIDLYRFCRIL